MQIHVRMFAGLKDYFEGTFTEELNSGETLEDLRARLIQKKPECQELFLQSRVACNNRFVEYHHIPEEGGEVSFMPPSSGG